MPDRSFVIVAVIAYLAPVVRELLARRGAPAIVFELVGGIVVGPQLLDIATTTAPVRLREGSTQIQVRATSPSSPSSSPSVIVATQIGLQSRIMEASTATALVAAGLMSVLAFPAIAFNLLERDRAGPDPIRPSVT